MALMGGCGKLRFGENNTRFLLLAVVIIVYMVCGALLFSFIEHGTENEMRTQYTNSVHEFQKLYPDVNETDLQNLLFSYGNATAKGLLNRRPRWDFSGSFYYVGTIVSTIGAYA